MVDLNDFKEEKECFYKDEHYSVRDNGAVLRHAQKDKRLRKNDNKWTFGNPNKNGYLQIASEVVHRVVAYAFLGAPPTPQHIVDHIDTNRQNNRPENLRWLTKLENILNNPITMKKIVFFCGSIEAFLEDPSILRNHITEDPNFGWMRAVSPEEAKNSWEHLSNWANRGNKESFSTGGSLGEWVFKSSQKNTAIKEYSEFVTSLTPNAIQKDWKTSSEFPCCPMKYTGNPIEVYTANLKVKKIFSRNQYSNSIIEDFATSKDKNTLWVLCRSSHSSVKPWSLAQVTYENKLFVHKGLGSFFEKDGAKKQFTLAQGLEWTGGDSVDDYS